MKSVIFKKANIVGVLLGFYNFWQQAWAVSYI